MKVETYQEEGTTPMQEAREKSAEEEEEKGPLRDDEDRSVMETQESSKKLLWGFTSWDEDLEMEVRKIWRETLTKYEVSHERGADYMLWLLGVPCKRTKPGEGEVILALIQKPEW